MTESSSRFEADNSRLQQANDQVLKVGYIKTVDELQLKMEGETVPEGIHKILYQARLGYDYSPEQTVTDATDDDSGPPDLHRSG